MSRAMRLSLQVCWLPTTAARRVRWLASRKRRLTTARKLWMAGMSVDSRTAYRKKARKPEVMLVHIPLGVVLGHPPVQPEDRQTHQDERQRSRQPGSAPADDGSVQDGPQQADQPPNDHFQADERLPHICRDRRMVRMGSPP